VKRGRYLFEVVHHCDSELWYTFASLICVL